MYKFDYKINLEMSGTVSIPAEKDFVERIQNKDENTFKSFGAMLKREIEKEMDCNIKLKNIMIEARKK